MKHRREEGGAAALALDYLLERLKGERPGLEVSKRTVGGPHQMQGEGERARCCSRAGCGALRVG